MLYDLVYYALLQAGVGTGVYGKQRREQNAFKGELINLRRTNKRSVGARHISIPTTPIRALVAGVTALEATRGHSLAPRVMLALQHETEWLVNRY